MKQYKPKEVLAFLKKQGWIEVRQHGSHVILRSQEKNKTIPLPLHNKDIPVGTLLSLLKQSGYTKEDLLG